MYRRSKRYQNMARFGAVLSATLSALIAWVVMVPVSGIELEVPTGSGTLTVGAGAVAFAAIVSGLAGIGTAALIGRWAKRPRRVWTILSVTVFLASLLGPLTSGAPIGIIGSLVALHSVVAVVLIPQLAWTLPRGRQASRSARDIPGGVPSL